MKITLTSLKVASLLALTGAIGIGALAAGRAWTSTTDSTGEYVDDSVITTKVKSALLPTMR
jgi:osmotically-inducible protein OsmY